MTLNQSEKIVKKCLRTSHGEACELWEPVQIKLEERRESIEDVLRNTARVLKEIAFTLKDDKNIEKQSNAVSE